MSSSEKPVDRISEDNGEEIEKSRPPEKRQAWNGVIKNPGVWGKPKYQREVDVRNPSRWTATGSGALHDYEDLKILRVRQDRMPPSQGASVTFQACAKLEWLESQVRELESQYAAYEPRRMVGVVFDCCLPGMPTVRQQFDILAAYHEQNITRLAWDGWDDTCVQFLNHDRMHNHFADLNIADDVMFHLHDHNHIAIPTISFLSKTPNYYRVPLAGICHEKTVAILDHGIDTFRYPRQLMALSVVAYGEVTEPFTAMIAKKLNKQHGSIAYRMRGGRVVVNHKLRTRVGELVEFVDNGKYASLSPAAKKQYLARVYPEGASRNFVPTENRMACLYVAHKLGYPPTLTNTIARMIVRSGNMNVMIHGPQAYDDKRARKILHEVSSRTGEAWKSIVSINIDKDARRLFKRASRQYKPSLNEPWLTRALAASPPRVVHDPRERLSAIGKRALRELRKTMSATKMSDEQALASYVECLISRIEAIEEKLFSASDKKKPGSKIKPRKLAVGENGASEPDEIRDGIRMSKSGNLVDVVDDRAHYAPLPSADGLSAVELDAAMVAPAWSGDCDPSAV